MAIEQFANNAATTLTGSLDAVTTSVPVSSAANFPAAAQYRIIVDNEIMIVTAGAGTSTWTVTRGAESTTAATHNNGASVRHTVTAGALSLLNQGGSRTSMPASYLGTPSTTVFFTAKSADSVTTFTVRTSTGVTESSSGLYVYNQPTGNLDSFLAIWDEGNPAVFTEELVVVDKVAIGTPLPVYVVASSDASAAARNAANYICDGANDDVEINQAITDANAASLPAGGYTIHGGTVLLVGQQFKISSPILMKTGVKLCGTGKSYTTIVAANGSTMSWMITLSGVNVERVELCDFNLHGNSAGATSGDGININNNGGSFTISPDPIHRIHDLDIRSCSGSGLTDGTNCRGSIIYNVRIQSCLQHGVQAIGSDSKWSQVSVIACGTDDGAMAYHGFNVTGANAQFVLCKAAFQRGRGWLFDTVRGSATSCQAQDNYGAGLDIGSNQNGCTFTGWVSDSNGMFPQGGIAGSDSGIYAQGGFFTLVGSSSDRGFATGNTDTGGNYGSTQNYGLMFRNDFASSCNITLTTRGNKTDSVTGGRVAAGDNHNIVIASDTTVNQVVYVNLPLATGGTFTLTDPDSAQTTSAISWNASGSTLASNIQTALRALAIFTTNLITAATGNETYQSKVTLAGSLAGTSRTPLTVNGTNLTGVGAPAAAAVLRGVTGGARTSEYRVFHGNIFVGASQRTARSIDAQISPGSFAPFEDATTHTLKLDYKNAAGTVTTIDLGLGT